MTGASRRAIGLGTALGSVVAGCVVNASWSAAANTGPGHRDHRPDEERNEPAHERVVRPRLIAHRGASHVAPENTYASFRTAIRHGTDRIEMDVRRTKDQRLVVLHDESLRRTTNVEKVFPRLKTPSVGDLRYEKLRRLDAGTWKGRRWKGTRIPRLARILRLGKRHDVRMIVELKDPGRYPGVVEQTLRLLRKRRLIRRGHRDPVQLQSFDLGAMRNAGRRSRRVDIGLLCPDPPVAFKRYKWADSVNAAYAEIGRKRVRRARRHGIRVVARGVNTRPAIRRAARLGVDAISTDRPKRTRTIIERRLQ